MGLLPSSGRMGLSCKETETRTIFFFLTLNLDDCFFWRNARLVACKQIIASVWIKERAEVDGPPVHERVRSMEPCTPTANNRGALRRRGKPGPLTSQKSSWLVDDIIFWLPEPETFRMAMGLIICMCHCSRTWQVGSCDFLFKKRQTTTKTKTC